MVFTVDSYNQLRLIAMFSPLYPTSRNFARLWAPQFSQHKKSTPIISQEFDDSLGIRKELREAQQHSLQQYKKSLPAQKAQAFLNHHLVDLILYFQHNRWQSQYIFNMLNIQQIGFKRVSDYGYLDQALYFLGNKQMKEEERWPVLKYSQPIGESDIVIGADNIYRFLDDRGLIKYDIDMEINYALLEHMDKNIIAPLQTIFWHPRLTLQLNFFFDQHSYRSGAQNYTILSTLKRNIWRVMKNTVKNLIKISKNKEQYEKSKQIFTKSIKQLELYFQGERQYLGGDSISYMDLYLYSNLCTKLHSEHFNRFLREDVGGKVWRWVFRMQMATKYNNQRMTFV